jgi:hypothetical protein
MTSDRDIERLLDRWLDDGPSIAPDRIIANVAARIGLQRQRPVWRLPWRDPLMNPLIKFATAVAAVGLVTALGFAILGRPAGPNIGGPISTPPPAASPSLTPAASPSPAPSLCATSDPACIGALAPGRHSTDALITPTTYTVPAGWSKTLDVPGAVNLEHAEAASFIAIWPDWNISSQDSCIEAPSALAGRGRTVDDLVTWLTEHEGVVASDPTPVTIDRIDGLVLDARMADDYTGPCGARALVFTHQGTINDIGAFQLNKEDRTRLWFFDVGEGHVVNLAIVVENSADFDGFLAAATPVVESMTFE